MFPVTGHSFLPNDRDFGRTELNKRKNERVYSPQQWMNIIEKSRVHKPFQSVDCDQSMFLDYGRHFRSIFKKTIKDNIKFFGDEEGMCSGVCKFSEVWVGYTMDESEEWRKFSIVKRHDVPSLPTESQKYTSAIRVKASNPQIFRR